MRSARDASFFVRAVQPKNGTSRCE